MEFFFRFELSLGKILSKKIHEGEKRYSLYEIIVKTFSFQTW